MGRFNMAAKTHTTIAELYETEAPDKERCMAEYQKAADYHKVGFRNLVKSYISNNKKRVD
jgi:hypothetical protein